MRAAVELEPFLPFLETGQLILTPGKRLAREIVSAWTRQCSTHTQVVIAPAVETVDSWLERSWHEAVEIGTLPAQRLLTSQQEQALWQQVIRDDLAGREGFTLTHPRAAANRARTAWNKLLMHRGADVADLWSYFQYDDDCQVFADWARRFEDRLTTLQAVTRYGAYRQLLGIETNKRPPAGLYANPTVPPMTLSCLEHLADIQLIDSAKRPSSEPEFMAFASRDDELAAVARWARESSAQRETRIGIVLLDMANDRRRLEYFLRQEFDCLDARYNDLPVNFSTGMPLSDTPLYRDALTALQWELQPLSRSDWIALMRSPFLPAHLEGRALLDLIAAQFRVGSSEVSIQSTLHLAAKTMPDAAITRILRAIRSKRDHRGVKNLLAWSEVIRGRLELWNWPSRRNLDSVEYQQLQRLEASLDALAELSNIVPHQTFEGALGLWRDCLQTTAFQPKTPFDSIQVLGPLEALGGQFDSLWISGAQEGVFPSKVSVEPFLPLSLQRKLGFVDLSLEQLTAQARTYLSAWNKASADSIVSFHWMDQDLPATPSPLIPPAIAAHRTTRFPPASWLGENGSEAMPIDRAVPIASTTHTGGATLIRDQAACPFRAFVKHRLKPAVLSPTIAGFSPAERGGLLHDVMYRIWVALETQDKLLTLDSNDEALLIDESASSALEFLEQRSESQGYSLRGRVGEACWDLEKEACVRVTKAWLSQERQRTSAFRVAELEQQHSLNLNGLELALRPDRIDELKDGRRLVIDYKTQAPAKTRWTETRVGEPQLPLYALLDNTIEGIAFGALSGEEAAKFIALGENFGLPGESGHDLEKQTRGLAQNWQDMVLHWQNVLYQLADEFLAGAAEVHPAPGACRYCDYEAVCRVRELRGGPIDAPENAEE